MRNLFCNHSPSGHPPSTFTQFSVPSNHDAAKREQVHSNPGSPNSLDRPLAPTSMSVNHQKTGNTGKLEMGQMAETAIVVVKESLKLVARISDAFPPLKTVVGGLVEIFDRIDVSLLSSNFINVVFYKKKCCRRLKMFKSNLHNCMNRWKARKNAWSLSRGACQCQLEELFGWLASVRNFLSLLSLRTRMDELLTQDAGRKKGGT